MPVAKIKIINEIIESKILQIDGGGQKRDAHINIIKYSFYYKQIWKLLSQQSIQFQRKNFISFDAILISQTRYKHAHIYIEIHLTLSTMLKDSFGWKLYRPINMLYRQSFLKVICFFSHQFRFAFSYYVFAVCIWTCNEMKHHVFFYVCMSMSVSNEE